MIQESSKKEEEVIMIWKELKEKEAL